MIKAEIICDSISPENIRITTFQLRYPKFIHGEFMTHRVISRNASSSRAVPTSKLLEEVRSDELRAKPVFWGINKPGMQDGGEINSWDRGEAERNWAYAANQAADNAEYMYKLGLHKQIVNRMIEPYTHINVVATATEWDNFFGLRLHKDADPTMQALADAIWDARSASTPKVLGLDAWHLPYVDVMDDDFNAEVNIIANSSQTGLTPLDFLIQSSVARCARVSFTSFETGKVPTLSEDLALYSRLLGAQPLHASPAEHQATPDEPILPHVFNKNLDDYEWKNMKEWGNLVGWRQYRKMLPGEAVAPLPEKYLSL